MKNIVEHCYSGIFSHFQTIYVWVQFHVKNFETSHFIHFQNPTQTFIPWRNENKPYQINSQDSSILTNSKEGKFLKVWRWVFLFVSICHRQRMPHRTEWRKNVEKSTGWTGVSGTDFCLGFCWLKMETFNVFYKASREFPRACRLLRIILKIWLRLTHIIYESYYMKYYLQKLTWIYIFHKWLETSLRQWISTMLPTDQEPVLPFLQHRIKIQNWCTRAFKVQFLDR